jgi:hypothetical protein
MSDLYKYWKVSEPFGSTMVSADTASVDEGSLTFYRDDVLVAAFSPSAWMALDLVENGSPAHSQKLGEAFLGDEQRPTRIPAGDGY